MAKKSELEDYVIAFHNGRFWFGATLKIEYSRPSEPNKGLRKYLVNPITSHEEVGELVEDLGLRYALIDWYKEENKRVSESQLYWETEAGRLGAILAQYKQRVLLLEHEIEKLNGLLDDQQEKQDADNQAGSQKKL